MRAPIRLLLASASALAIVSSARADGISSYSPTNLGLSSAAPPTYTAGMQPLSLDLSGNLRVSLGTAPVALAAGTASVGTVGLNAGTNLVGAFSLDIGGAANTAANPAFVQVTNPSNPATAQSVQQVPSASTAVAITPVVSTALESSHVLKAAAGNLYNVTVTNTGSTTGYLMVLNTATAPASGATVAPIEYLAVAPGGALSVAKGSIPDAYSTGITVAFSSTGPFTFTPSPVAFFHGEVQ